MHLFTRYYSFIYSLLFVYLFVYFFSLAFSILLFWLLILQHPKYVDCVEPLARAELKFPISFPPPWGKKVHSSTAYYLINLRADS